MCSSPDSETMISAVSPIADLIHHVKYSFRERVFNEVQNILTDRENRMKSEIEALVRECDSAREEARNTRRKSQELEATVAELLREIRVSSDREKRADDRHARNSELIADLNATISELKLENSEANKTLGESEMNRRRLEDLKFQDFGGKKDHCSGIGRKPESTNKEGAMSGEGCFSRLDDGGANPVDENEADFEKLVQSPSSCQRSSKRDSAGLSGDMLANWTTKRKRNTCTSHEDNTNNTNAVAVGTQKTLHQKLDSLSDEDSSDSDGSCSDSKISDLIASLKSKKH